MAVILLTQIQALCLGFMFGTLFMENFVAELGETLILVNGAWNCSEYEQFQVVLSKTDMQGWIPGVGDNHLSF
jgi:hypothetical protein